jgi:hypothetical protein
MRALATYYGVTSLSAIHNAQQGAPGSRFCDFLDPPGSPTVGPQAYVLNGSRGGKPNRTYVLAASVTAPSFNLVTVLPQAFAPWIAAAPALGAQQVNTGPADISIGFGAFPKPGILAQTAANGSSITFSPAAGQGRNNPVSIAIHEIGHAFGLGHNTNANSVMFPFNNNLTVLSSEDVAAIRALYGWAPQRPVRNVGTAAGPALCACGGKLLMAWRGIPDDEAIWFSTSGDGLNWQPQQALPGAGTTDSPTLAWDGTQAWMAWKGSADDTALWYSTSSDLKSWAPQQSVGPVGSSCAPSIAFIPGLGPMLAWRGADADEAIWYTTWSGGWQPQASVGGVGTSDRPTLTVDVSGGPRLVWKGIEGDDGLYTTTQRGTPRLFWDPQQKVSWIQTGNPPQPNVSIGTPGSDYGPGLDSFGGRVLMAWHGAGDDQDLWFTQGALGGAAPQQFEWSTQAQVAGFATSSRPAVAAFSGNVFLAWKGIEGDTGIYITFV